MITRRLTTDEIQYMLDNLPPPLRKDHCQTLMVDEWNQRGRRGTLEAATGVGKTRSALLAIDNQFKLDPNALVYVAVPTIQLRDNDWPAEFKKWGYEKYLGKVRFICYASLDSERPERDVDLLICDEIHHITPLNSTFLLNPVNSWKVWNVLGLTATLPKSDRSIEEAEKLAIINRFAPSIFKISIEESVELELVSDFDVIILKAELNGTDKYITSGSKDKPFMTTELGYYMYLTNMLKKTSYNPKFAKVKFIWTSRRVKFLGSLRSKKRVLVDILNQIIKPENRTLIFNSGIAVCNELFEGNVYHSKVDGTALDKFQEKEINYLGVVQALNEGKNVVDLDQILIASISSSDRELIQRIGRTIRFREGFSAKVIVTVMEGTVEEKWCNEAFKDFDRKRIKVIRIKVPKDEPEKLYRISPGERVCDNVEG